MSAMTGRERAVLTIFALVLAPLFAALYGARPLLRVYGERTGALAQQRELLARERAAVSAAPALSVPIVAARSAVARASRGIIQSAALSTAFSALTDHLRSSARRQDVLVLQMTEMPGDSIVGGHSVLRVALRAESDLAGITRYLRSLESDALRLRVSRVFIERAGQDQFGGSAAATDGRTVLILNATIESLARVVPAGADR